MSQTTPTTLPQRDAGGHFAKGNKGGPGNPFGRHREPTDTDVKRG